MRCLPMRQQQSCCRHAAQPYIPLWGPYIPSIDRKWMFRQIGSGYHYCQLVHGPLANFPHTKNSVLAVTTRRLELYNCSLIAALSLLLSHPCSSITTLSLLLLLSSLLSCCQILAMVLLLSLLPSHCCVFSSVFSLLCSSLIVVLLLLNSFHCSLITMLSSHACSSTLVTAHSLPCSHLMLVPCPPIDPLLFPLSHCYALVPMLSLLPIHPL